MELLISFIVGAAIGVIYFAGLWETIRKLPDAEKPVRRMALSYALRMTLALSGFYFVMQGEWERLAAAMVGFLLMRGCSCAVSERRPTRSWEACPMEVVAIDQISPDQVILFAWGFVTINATLLYTWLVMGLLVVGSIVITGNLSSERTMSRWQNMLEVIVGTIRSEIRDIAHEGSDTYFPFIATLFLFILFSNVFTFIPGYVAPTSSLTTTAALAVMVFIAVPMYGIAKNGILEYLKEYFRPTFIFFPFHVMGEFSRTLALAVRLFGNLMSHEKVIAILLAVTPLFFPVVMQVLGLLIGLIQAYIFAILAMVYIASATQTHEETEHKPKKETEPVKI